MAKKKVLLMGKAHSGKTSMRSIIFANYLARDTMRLSATLDVEHHHVRFLGDLVLNLWDCGGQDAFYESYFERDRETIFRSVELLIYVFDISSECVGKDFEHFAGVLGAIEENSPDARIFVLVHKMDLVVKEEQEMILDDRKRMIEERCTEFGVRNFQCYGTSIWDESLYKAWSEIVTNLIPNIDHLESQLDDFCKICDADEVVLFERATFLVISQSNRQSLLDDGDSDNDDPDEADNTDASTAATPPPDNNAEAHTLTSIQTPTDIAVATHNNNDLNTLTPISTSIADNAGVLITDSAAQTNPPPFPVFPNDDENASAASSLLEGAMPTSIDGNFNDSQILPSVFSEVTGANSAAQGRGVPNGHHGGAVRSPTSGNASNRSSGRSNNANHVQANQPQRQRQRRGRRQRRQRQQQVVLDTHRFEKISNIVKQFKLSCEKAQSQFQGMEVSNSRFTACIDAFTANTYIMVIVSQNGGSGGAWNGAGMSAKGATTLLNIKNARGHFERLIPMS